MCVSAWAVRNMIWFTVVYHITIKSMAEGAVGSTELGEGYLKF